MPQYSTAIRDVLKKEFPISDVAGGQLGKPLFSTKGNSHIQNVYFVDDILKYILIAIILEASVLHFIQNSNIPKFKLRNSIYLRVMTSQRGSLGNPNFRGFPCWIFYPLWLIAQ